ncbi:uncharacterized protein Bfra_005106 [Botrytis fragariae]|uniref:Uncharacterized protein n=1 Tax=Botrytis fragariae TaxID=1964551 RepID=A0A8H6AU56_9HELO|nr:uncharacterized protein Bfra_005106 [Botrytis fragariae]KAF5873642.1 hypothetical protein Bfra_005106 [Botrytis fragariae]
MFRSVQGTPCIALLPNLQQPYRKIATHVLKKPIHDQKHQEHKSDEVENNHRELSQNVRKRKTVREKVTKEAKPIPPVRIQSVRLSSPHPANYLRPNKTELHCLPVKIHKLRNASTQGTPPPKLLKSTVILPATSKLKPISPVRTGAPPHRVIRTTRATMLRQDHQLRTQHNISNRDLLLKAVVSRRVLRARENKTAMLQSFNDEANGSLSAYDLITIHGISETQAQDGEELVLPGVKGREPFRY